MSDEIQIKLLKETTNCSQLSLNETTAMVIRGYGICIESEDVSLQSLDSFMTKEKIEDVIRLLECIKEEHL